MKIYIFLFFYCSTVFAFHKNYELLLYDKIFSLIFNKNPIKVYGDKKDMKIFGKSSKFIVVKNCKNSDLIFGNIEAMDKKCKNIPRFVKSYKLYKTLSNVIGAFYWRKGRPQLQLNMKNINKNRLFLPKELKKYAQ